jgi:hypothetical protein
VIGVLRFTEGFYKASLDDDFKRYGVKAVPLAEVAQPLTYSDDLKDARKLKPDRDSLETPHLKLTTHTRKEWATTPDGQGFRYEHILLSITNKTDKPIAYRIDTTIDHVEKCRSKGSIPHNAVALRPGETLERSECLWHPGAMLTVKSIEVLDLTDLGYYYVSQLEPSQVLIDARTSMGHTPPKGAKPCQFVPWREIQQGVTTGTTWADVIDFYARHNCNEPGSYSFFRGYKRWTSPGSLPAHATAANTPPPATATVPAPAPAAAH